MLVCPIIVLSSSWLKFHSNTWRSLHFKQLLITRGIRLALRHVSEDNDLIVLKSGWGERTVAYEEVDSRLTREP